MNLKFFEESRSTDRDYLRVCTKGVSYLPNGFNFLPKCCIFMGCEATGKCGVGFVDWVEVKKGHYVSLLGEEEI